MPTTVSEFDGEPEIFGKLHQKLAQRLPAVFGSERWRQLNQDNLQFRFEWFDRTQKRIQLRGAIAQPANVGDVPRKLATEAKRSWRHFNPPPDRVLGRHRVKRGVDLHRRQIARVKFKPFGFREVGRIKTSSPLLKTPGAGADANFLLIGQVQFAQNVS